MTHTSCWLGGCGFATALLVPLSAAAQPVAEVTPASVAPPSSTPEVAPAGITPKPYAPVAAPTDLTPSPSAPPRRLPITGIRFEVGLEGGAFFDIYNFTSHATENLGFGAGGGIHLRVGVQIKDWLGAQLEGSGGLIGVAGYGRGAVTVNFTPIRWFTVSIGPAFGTFSNIGGSAKYVGLTLRSDFHVYQYRSASGQRHSFTIGLGGDGGGSFDARDTSGPIAGGMLNFGYTMH